VHRKARYMDEWVERWEYKWITDEWVNNTSLKRQLNEGLDRKINEPMDGQSLEWIILWANL
jgi:hypothetical protein